MGASQRRKGADFERQIARELAALTGVSFKRDLAQYQESERGDLIASDPDWPFLIECKHHTRAALPEWRRQAIKAASEGQRPCVVYRITGGPVRVSVRLSDILDTLPANEWAEVTLPAFAALAGELMAGQSVRSVPIVGIVDGEGRVRK